MEVGKIDLTAIDSTAEMKRVLPSDICDGIIEIIKVLEDRSSLPVAAQIESSLHENLRKWIVKGRAGYAKTGQCHYSGDTSGARRRVGKTYLRINLAQQTAGAVESEHGLKAYVCVREKSRNPLLVSSGKPGTVTVLSPMLFPGNSIV